MRFKFEYIETCGGIVELTEEQSQKIKEVMDKYDMGFEQAYWQLVNEYELPEPWELCDMDFVESEIESVEEIDDGE